MWYAAGQWYSPATVSSTNETDRHYIVESGIKHHNPNPIITISILLSNSIQKYMTVIPLAYVF